LVDDAGKQATVIVPDDQLSLAIGREGQNARLAARLTGWRIDIRSETEFAAEEAEHGYEEEETSGRCAAILTNGRRCPNAALPGSRYCGLEAHQALAAVDAAAAAEPPAGDGAPGEPPAADGAPAEPPVADDVPAELPGGDDVAPAQPEPTHVATAEENGAAEAAPAGEVVEAASLVEAQGEGPES
jgi:N utilization substance protein A